MTLFIISAVVLLATLKFFGKISRRAGKKAAVTLILLAFLFVCGTLCMALFPKDDSSLGNEDAVRLFASHGFILSQEIAKDSAAGKVVVLVEEGKENNEVVQGFLRVMAETLPKELTVTMLPVSAAAAGKFLPEDRPAFNDLVKAADYNVHHNEMAQAKAVIFISGLPSDIRRMRLFGLSKNNRPKIFVVNCERDLQAAVNNGFITAYTAPDPKADFTSKRIPAEYAAAFASRYKLVI